MILARKKSPRRLSGRKFKALKIQPMKIDSAQARPLSISGIALARIRQAKAARQSVLSSAFVVARNVRNEWASARSVMLALACLIAIVPLLLASSGDNGLHRWFSNRAYAAINPAADTRNVDGLSPAERRRQAASVRALLSSNPAGLIGMRSRDIALAFPAPELERREGDITVRQYRAGECVIDVYFGGSDKNAGNRQVVYYEARPRGKAVLGAVADMSDNKASASGCLKTVLTDTREFPVLAFAAAAR